MIRSFREGSGVNLLWSHLTKLIVLMVVLLNGSFFLNYPLVISVMGQIVGDPFSLYEWMVRLGVPLSRPCHLNLKKSALEGMLNICGLESPASRKSDSGLIPHRQMPRIIFI